jgi:two-component system chemotaxis sensor kinase CheA
MRSPTAAEIVTLGHDLAQAEAAEPRMFALPKDFDHDLMQEYLIEVRDYLQQAEQALLALESAPTDLEQLKIIYRAFHSIKGVSGFVGMTCISQIAHAAESLYDKILHGKLLVESTSICVAFGALDALNEMIGSLTVGLETGSIPVPEQYDRLLEILENPKRAEAFLEQATPKPAASAAAAATPCSRMVRVDSADLDQLLSLSRELVAAADLLPMDEDLSQDSSIHALAKSIQKTVTALRMVTMSDSIQKLSRMVRDLAVQLGKDITFASVGDHQKLERDVVEALQEPLMHLIRNAVDHGIESPEGRLLAGKPTTGRITLFIAREPDAILVALSDDGRGLDYESIQRKAQAEGLIEQTRDLSASDMQRLVFAPGFSTAGTVTDISGRGMGLDIVQSRLEAIAATITVSSTLGQGTTFTLRIPSGSSM